MTEARLIAWELVQTAHVVGLRFSEMLGSLDLSPTQFAILMQLDADAGLTQTELARLVLVRQQSMGVLVAAMVERGLLVRDGPGGRGRRARLSLTEAGREALGRAQPEVLAFNAPAAMGLTADRAERVLDGLRRIQRSMDALG